MSQQWLAEIDLILCVFSSFNGKDSKSSGAEEQLIVDLTETF